MTTQKILCTNAYFYQYDKKQWKTAQPYPPLGTLYAIAALRENNFSTSFFDNNLVANHDEIYKIIDEQQPEILVIYDDGFNYLTKMCLSNMQNATFDIIKYAKDRGITTICNSSDSTDHYKTYHDKGADYVIHGEGEDALVELCTAISNNEDTSKFLGISYLKNDEIVLNSKRPVKRNLDELPMPAWELIDVEKYRNIWIQNYGYFSLNLATTRGCPYKCNWCAKPIYGNRYNSRSPENVMNEIEFLVKKFDVNYFWMCDDIFGLKPGWVQKFRDEKVKRGLSFKYKIQSRVDLMLQDDHLDALADSGADMIWVGAESGSQKILDAMDKGTKVQQIYDATEKLQSRDVNVAFFLQFGYLGETWSDIQKTIKMVLDLVPDDIGISVSYPLPGTKFYDKVKADLILKTNWTESDDLDLMFKNNFPPIFYKTLHRYVHNRYRIKKGLLRLRNPFSSIKKTTIDFGKMVYHFPMAVLNRSLLHIYATRQS